jgi:putative membrane protein
MIYSMSAFGEATMIRNFTDHSANERTFLAWIRTGIAVIAFGFVVEKFNLFILALTSTAVANVGLAVRTDRLAGPLGRYEGVALMLVGIALIALAGVRFVRTTRMIDASEPQGGSVRSEVAITIVLVLLVAVYCLSFVFK